ncbi:hypothetical protein BGX23_012556 [Mortierella sp. AD031]|nr:hypothetical protein BGX23_012556 [Mortierella sp. AD031]
MNRGIGLVAYGDSDSDSSDEEMPLTSSSSSSTTIKTGTSSKHHYSNNSNSLNHSFVSPHLTLRPIAATQQKQGSTTTKDTTDSAQERPSPQDTISARSIVQSKPIIVGQQESLNKVASTNLLKQGLAAAAAASAAGAVSSDSIHSALSLSSSSTSTSEAPTTTGAVAALESSSTPVHGSSFTRSASGTPLPADHSAASDVFNTPTTGQSPRVPQTSRVPIADEAREDNENDGESQDGSSSEQTDGGHGSTTSRAALMRSLLRPKPISGFENFGIPPSPEGDISPGVQAKIEQFYMVKMTRDIHFNQSLMKNKNFRNPRIYQALVEQAGLNEIGTNFGKSEFFDIEGYGPESYAPGLAEAQKQTAEKLAQQQAMARSHIQFVPGSTVPPGVALSSSSQATTAAAAGSGGVVALGSQRPRKSKWDSTR